MESITVNESVTHLHHFFVENSEMWVAAETMVVAAWQTGWIQNGVALFTVLMFYVYLVRPLNWKRDLTDVGYSHVHKGVRKHRADAMRDVRRRRRVGTMPPVYPNGWFALLESDDLKRGQVKHVTALGENFAVLRDSCGQAHILDAYCPHLGANMAVGGNVRGDCLECPFHGWQFRASDGQCTAIPYAKKIPDFAKVRRWECLELNQLIFVWYHAEGEEPSWKPEQVPQVASGEWRFRGRSEFLVNSHIQEIPENGGDVAHLNAIHAPAVLAGGDLTKYNKTIFSFIRHVWAAEWGPVPDRPHQATMLLQHEIRLCNKLSVFTVNLHAEQIGPGYVEMYLESSLGKCLIVQSVTPVEAMLQRVIHRVFTTPRLFLFAPVILVSEAIMFERDVMVWNHKKYEDKPLLVREDATLQRHRRWYNQFYSENSPRFSFAQDSLDW